MDDVGTPGRRSMAMDVDGDGSSSKRTRRDSSSLVSRSQSLMDVDSEGVDCKVNIDIKDDEKKKRDNIKARAVAKPIACDKKAPAKINEKRGDRRCVLKSNFVALKDLPAADIYMYEVVIDGDMENKKTMRNIQKAGADDAHRIARRNTCFDMVVKIIKNNPALFDDNPYTHFVYDRNRTLFTIAKLSGVGDEKSITVHHVTSQKGEYKVTFRQSDRGLCCMRLNEFHRQYASRNLDEQDHSIQQFIEIATSQALYKSSDYVSASNRVTYRKEAQPERLPGTGTYVANGFSKSCKVTSDGLMLIIEPKTTNMWFDHTVLDLLTEVGVVRDPRQWRPAQRDIGVVTSMVRGLRVQATHRDPAIEFQVAAVSVVGARSLDFDYSEQGSTNSQKISVADYFGDVLKKPLKYPDLPCLAERKVFKGKRTMSYYPIEVCRVMKYQRVTVKQQTPKMQQIVGVHCVISYKTWHCR